MRRSPLMAALLACFMGASGARAADPVFRASPDTLRANDLGEWRATLTLENRSQWGLYPDSLTIDWVSADPDSSAAPRSGTTDMNSLVRLVAPASAGESTGLEWSAPAEFERGTLVFRMAAHDAQKTHYSVSARVPVAGSDLYDAHPSLLLASGDRKVELLILPADSTARPAPAVLYVPPSGTAARSLLRWSMPFVIRGYTVAIVSQAGSGRSSGPADRSGPASVAGVSAAIDRVVHAPGVDGARVLVWGQGDGATTALLAAAKHPELAGVIAADAGYDPWTTYRALPEPARAAYLRSAGRDSAAWRARSPLVAATRIKPPVLVLQTLESGITNTASAQAFVTARAQHQLYVEARLNGVEPKPFRRFDATRVTLDFMARRTHKP